MSVQIQTRRGTAAEWTSANPTLAQGEEGYETDTGRTKRGNGSTVWTSLPYLDQLVLPPITASGTTLTLGPEHNGRVIICTHASGCAVTVPHTLAPGLLCTLIQRGAAAVTAAGSGGLTVSPEPTFVASTFGVGSPMTIYVESATVAACFGDLAEAP